MTHIACTLCRPPNIKFVSVKFTIDFEDLAKLTFDCTFQTFFQLPIETRQTQTNLVSGAIEDLTTFGRPDDLSLMSVDDFSAMVLLTSLQVGTTILKQTELDITDASLNDFDL